MRDAPRVAEREDVMSFDDKPAGVAHSPTTPKSISVSEVELM